MSSYYYYYHLPQAGARLVAVCRWARPHHCRRAGCRLSGPDLSQQRWWAAMTNQRPAFRSGDYSWPIRGKRPMRRPQLTNQSFNLTVLDVKTYLALLLLLVTKVLEPGFYLNRKWIKLFSISVQPTTQNKVLRGILPFKYWNFFLLSCALESFPTLYIVRKVAKVWRLTFVFQI